jgi:hypothetical protein
MKNVIRRVTTLTCAAAILTGALGTVCCTEAYAMPTPSAADCMVARFNDMNAGFRDDIDALNKSIKELNEKIREIQRVNVEKEGQYKSLLDDLSKAHGIKTEEELLEKIWKIEAELGQGRRLVFADGLRRELYALRTFRYNLNEIRQLLPYPRGVAPSMNYLKYLEDQVRSAQDEISFKEALANKLLPIQQGLIKLAADRSCDAKAAADALSREVNRLNNNYRSGNYHSVRSGNYHGVFDLLDFSATKSPISEFWGWLRTSSAEMSRAEESAGKFRTKWAQAFGAGVSAVAAVAHLLSPPSAQAKDPNESRNPGGNTPPSPPAVPSATATATKTAAPDSDFDNVFDNSSWFDVPKDGVQPPLDPAQCPSCEQEPTPTPTPTPVGTARAVRQR